MAIFHSKLNLFNTWKSPLLIGKSTMFMAIFHSYVKFPEGIHAEVDEFSFMLRLSPKRVTHAITWEISHDWGFLVLKTGWSSCIWGHILYATKLSVGGKVEGSSWHIAQLGGVCPCSCSPLSLSPLFENFGGFFWYPHRLKCWKASIFRFHPFWAHQKAPCRFQAHPVA